ncbi:transcriptional regulator, LacI family [Asanoa ishikariensis]|uniref:Transcriptional regulator, LacI family n=1 Tax=Asanoa ishikariensis TaxID=137265 RepID=A0A1H3TAS9_9ACTN|nr:LacI family DNA-binding transcriptional regulator [Asanoa ishikariensis]SDZ47372.1 transcriptional regulator, LacI family [Asanoa ishikariensis]
MKALSKSKAATIYEVARHAGVSIATVSRALRDSDLVTESTRARVRAAVEALNYTPNQLGRSLAEGRHAANGIVFPDLTGPYYAEVVLGYEEAASELGRSVLILATHGRRDAEAAVLDLAGRVDGLAVMGNTVGDDTVRSIAATGVPLVLLARPPVDGVDTIRTRNERTAAELAAHLLAHGHRRIVFVGDPEAAPDMAGRYAGLAKTMRAHGLPKPDCRPCSYDVEAGERIGAQLMADPPDAVVCANDEVALGVHLAAEAAGRSVPHDLAVTGWDDVLAARFAGLTTVSQPMRELGATAARWLDGRIAERTAGPERATPRRRVLPTQLVVRRSCGSHPVEIPSPLGGTA